MGTSEKIMHYANFNITYGPTEDPMLTHFEDIIWPAFLSDFKRGKKNEHPLFYLSDIALKEISGDMVLVGNYIKDTQYDIRTTVISARSIFCISLRADSIDGHNVRMSIPITCNVPLSTVVGIKSTNSFSSVMPVNVSKYFSRRTLLTSSGNTFIDRGVLFLNTNRLALFI